MEHARATFVYRCAHESLKYTLGYKNTVQLSVYVSIVSGSFSTSLKKRNKRTLRQMWRRGSSHKDAKCSLDCRFFKTIFQLYNKTP